MTSLPPEYDTSAEILAESVRIASLFDAEGILPRVHSLQWLQARCPYIHIPQRTQYWTRIAAALKVIPPQHHTAAVALFSRVLYFDKDVLDSITRELVMSIGRWCKMQGLSPKEDTFVFSIDHPELIKSFFDFGGELGWEGRADNKLQIDITSISHLLQKLGDCAEGHSNTIKQVSELFKRRVWIIVTDNALGGGSAISDLLRAVELSKMFAPDSPPRIVFATQLYSDFADRRISVIPGLKEIAIFYGVRLSDGFRIFSDDCDMFSQNTLASVRKLCHWFGTECFGRETGDLEAYPFWNTLNRHREPWRYDYHFCYGWQDSGFTVVTYKNSPTNSVPLLWFPCRGEKLPPRIDLASGQDADSVSRYSPPFPRNSSRKTQNTAGDSGRMETVRSRAAEIRKLLWNPRPT